MEWRHDKKLHLMAGFALSFLGYFWPPLFWLGPVAGVLKELWDWLSKTGTPELMDMYATWVGSLLAGIALSLLGRM